MRGEVVRGEAGEGVPQCASGVEPLMRWVVEVEELW